MPPIRRSTTQFSSLRFARRGRLIVAALLILAGLALGLSAHGARAGQPAWPPPPGSPAIAITVYADGYHSFVTLPADAATTASASTPPQDAVFEAWAFGERIWFMEDKHGFREYAREAWWRAIGVVRVLFWPSRGVVQVCAVACAPDAAWQAVDADGDGAAPARMWRFTVTPEGWLAMRQWIDSWRGADTPILDEALARGSERYYPSRVRYHMFNTCHHFTAGALRAAGLPIHPARCVTPGGLYHQLDRAAAIEAASFQAVGPQPPRRSRFAWLWPFGRRGVEQTAPRTQAAPSASAAPNAPRADSKG